MAKLLELINTRNPGPDQRQLAPQVAEKLAAAERHLGELKAQVAEIALDEALARPGSAEKLAALNGRIGGAQTEVDQLRLAHQLALRKDATAAARARNRIRSAQFAAFRNHAAARFEVAVELCVALETAAKAYRAFLDLSAKMAKALPIGTGWPPGMTEESFELWINGQPYPTQFDVLIAAQMYKHSGVTTFGGTQARALPAAAAPTMALQYQPDLIEPASESVKRVNEYFLATIKAQIEALDHEEQARIEQAI